MSLRAYLKSVELLCRARQRLAFAHDVDRQNLGPAWTALCVVNGFERDLIAVSVLQRFWRLTVDHEHELAFQHIAPLHARMRVPSDQNVRNDLGNSEDRFHWRTGNVIFLQRRALDCRRLVRGSRRLLLSGGKAWSAA